MEDNNEMSLLLLELDEIRYFQQNAKGKESEGTLSDFHFAILEYKLSLENRLRFLQDRRVAQSIAQSTAEGLENDTVEDFSRLNVGGPEGSSCHDEEAEAFSSQTSSSQASSSFADISHTKSCSACLDSTPSDALVPLSCEHAYCIACVVELFTSALTDESLFPPRCCRQVIDLDKMSHLLPRRLVELFREKSIEFTSTNRIYCHNTACAKFIPPTEVKTGDGWVMCPSCKQSTCVTCKKATHEEECPEDETLLLLHKVAKDNGWRSCYSCHRIVELTTGCNHITCICRAQFCYQCGLQWKECKCAQWQEENLLARAQLIRARRGVNEGVRLIQTRLRRNHSCDIKHAWRYVGGQDQCEECHFNCPKFIFRCQRCYIQVCLRCRNNRV